MGILFKIIAAALAVVLLLVIGVPLWLVNYPAPLEPVPIASGPLQAEKFVGQPAVARPMQVSLPDHPYLAPRGLGTIHSGGHNSDVHFDAGPLGNNTRVVSRMGPGPGFMPGMCSITVFGKEDKLITFCGAFAGWEFNLFEPKTLELLARYKLPMRPSTFETIAKADFDIMMSDTSGGAYFYKDNEGYIVFADSEQQVQRVGHRKNSDGEWEFFQQQRWDLSNHVPQDCFSVTNWNPGPEDCDPITSVTPDYEGTIWWVTRKGRIGTINPETGDVRLIQLRGEDIQNSFSAAANGVFIVSDHAMYGLKAGPDGTPQILWKEFYDRGSVRKVGLATQGAGTTPTLLGDRYVTHSDNADGQVNLIVWNREPEFEGDRLVCKTPLFEDGQSATEISMIGYDRTIIIENTNGYWNAHQQTEWGSVVGGISRIDIREDDSGCDIIWTSSEISPSGVGKLSVPNGLVYYPTLTAQPNGENAWYITALDVETGDTRFKVLTGVGSQYDVNWGPITISPDGTIYSSVKQGFIAVWDE